MMGRLCGGSATTNFANDTNFSAIRLVLRCPMTFEMATILLSAATAIVVSLITAYVTTRISAKQEQKKWNRDLAQKLVEMGVSDSEGEIHAPSIAVERLARQFAVGYLVYRLPESEAEKVFIPPTGRIMVGRSDPTTGSIAEIDFGVHGGMNGISRRHALFEAIDSTVFVVDLHSTNGILVNGKRLDARERQKLKSGDIIRLGHIDFSFFALSK